MVKWCTTVKSNTVSSGRSSRYTDRSCELVFPAAVFSWCWWWWWWEAGWCLPSLTGRFGIAAAGDVKLAGEVCAIYESSTEALHALFGPDHEFVDAGTVEKSVGQRFLGMTIKDTPAMWGPLVLTWFWKPFAYTSRYIYQLYSYTGYDSIKWTGGAVAYHSVRNMWVLMTTDLYIMYCLKPSTIILNTIINHYCYLR